MTLGDFLQAQTANDQPWNCSTMAADYCVTLGHPDFAADWRHITDPGLCDSVPLSAGGLVVLWARGIGDALPVVEAIEAGDIAVVSAFGLEAGAIWTGERWAIRAGRGLHFLGTVGVRVVRAWRP